MKISDGLTRLYLPKNLIQLFKPSPDQKKKNYFLNTKNKFLISLKKKKHFKTETKTIRFFLQRVFVNYKKKKKKEHQLIYNIYFPCNKQTTFLVLKVDRKNLKLNLSKKKEKGYLKLFGFFKEFKKWISFWYLNFFKINVQFKNVRNRAWVLPLLLESYFLQ